MQAVQAVREMQGHLAGKDRQLAELQEEVSALRRSLAAAASLDADVIGRAAREAVAGAAGGAAASPAGAVALSSAVQQSAAEGLKPWRGDGSDGANSRGENEQ